MIPRIVLLIVALGASPASASPELRRLDADTVLGLAGAARRGELALVESNSDGTMRQVTMVVFVRAPADKVRALVADVGGYLRFVPNLKQADFKREPDGRWVNTWRLELPIATFAGRDAYELDDGPLGEVRFHSLQSLATYAWSFVPVEGGSLLVQHGYTDVLHSNRFVRAFVRRQPALEHGLALAAQYMLVSAIKRQAERQAGPDSASPARAAGASSLEHLTDRGQVVVMRANPDGSLAEVSAVDRAYASEDRVYAAIADPAVYSHFIAGVDRSIVTSREDGIITYLLDMSLPILTWSTTYRMRALPHVIDGVGVDGDLRGARYRWDLASRGGKQTLVTYRANMPLGRSNILVKKLFEVDRSLEHGLNVAFALLMVRSVRGRAEGWLTH